MSTTLLPTTPGYGHNYPQMPGGLLGSDFGTNLDLGWISDLFKVANKTLNKLYGDYSEVFKLNEEDLLSFDDLNADTFTKNSTGPIIYLAAWLAVLVLVAITGFCWCLCNKCCCCCISSFKGKNIDDLEDRPNSRFGRLSARNAKKQSGGITPVAIVVAILMAVWLIGFLIMILHTFASNDKLTDGVGSVQPHLEKSVQHLETYMNTTINQLTDIFDKSFNILDTKIKHSLAGLKCNSGPPLCDEDTLKKAVNEKVDPAVNETRKEITKNSETLKTAIEEVRDSMRNGKNDLDENVEDIISQITDGMYWLFMFFNVLYCIIFGLVLIGTILAAFGRSGGLKTGGFLFIRVAIVIMFILGIVIILQLMAMFIVAGVGSEIICPAVRDLENDPTGPSKALGMPSTTDTVILMESKQMDRSYETPGFGQIIRACKKDESAYNAFNLQTAFDIKELSNLVTKFELTPTLPPDLAKNSNAEETLNNIKGHVEEYATYVQKSTEEKLGNCKPAYHVIDSTVSLFCDEITAPVSCFWWILQFIPLVFILIFITALFFERAQT